MIIYPLLKKYTEKFLGVVIVKLGIIKFILYFRPIQVNYNKIGRKFHSWPNSLFDYFWSDKILLSKYIRKCSVAFLWNKLFWTKTCRHPYYYHKWTKFLSSSSSYAVSRNGRCHEENRDIYQPCNAINVAMNDLRNGVAFVLKVSKNNQKVGRQFSPKTFQRF